MTTAGTAVLAIGVPELDGWVRERTAHYDATFLSSDPDFAHAHITVLAPWLPQPTEADLDAVGEIAAATPPFAFTLGTPVEFPDGLIHLAPEPAGPFSDLTERLHAAFPQCPPYAGQFDPVIPHLTLDKRTADISPETVAAPLGDVLPLEAKAARLDLQWWANDDCRVLRSWRLG